MIMTYEFLYKIIQVVKMAFVNNETKHIVYIN